MYFLHHSCCCIKPSCWIQFVWKVKCSYVAAIFRFQSLTLLLCFHGQKYRNTYSPWSQIQGGNSCRLKRSSAPAAEFSVRRLRSSKLLNFLIAGSSRGNSTEGFCPVVFPLCNTASRHKVGKFKEGLPDF